MLARGHRCPHCGRSMAELRFGIKFSRKRLAFIDLLMRRAHHGATSVEIAKVLYADTAREIILRNGKHVHTVRAMRNQINEVFSVNRSPWRITTDREFFYLQGGRL